MHGYIGVKPTNCICVFLVEAEPLAPKRVLAQAKPAITGI
jgi:hypothetical protein